MSMNDLKEKVMEKANLWLEGNIDENSKAAIREMIENDEQELIESFYRDLEFGTGGLRGIMGTGTNRMNRYTVGMATQGLANYLKKVHGEHASIKVAIAHDSRNNSDKFARITAEVFSANGIKVYLFDGLRPTPELSFAIRHYGCQSGVVITASHNPKEYNGYKAYWDDGAQLIPPHDKNVIEEVKKIRDFDDVRFKGNDELIELIGEETDVLYLGQLKKLSLSPDVIRVHSDIPIVYTPLHGTGADLVPRCLKNFGFTNISLVEEQATPDGNFPTVKSPNPEESSALEMAINKARLEGASLVMATDPDGDRVGIAVKNDKGEFVLMNGNQTAAVLLYYIFRKWKENGRITGKEYMVKTIVTSELLIDLANKYGIETYDVLTGFKWIADIIRKNEGKKTFIAGGEESYGYMIGDFVRDKDAVSSCAMIAEAAAWAASQGKTIFDVLQDIYLEFGFYLEGLLSVVKKGMSGADEIKKIMEGFRAAPPTEVNGSKIVMIKDYELSIAKDMVNGTEETIGLPKSNVLQFFLEDGSKISMRPSGTEPKIKFYIGVKAELNRVNDYDAVYARLEEKIQDIIKSLEL
ncbi:MAG: phospho-sugar mutase [Bacteroidales bacterium]|nr:phospho-sugar mutase [Bacteroidales bacterium]